MSNSHLSQALVDAARHELGQLAANTKGINIAVLTSSDGFKIAAAGSDDDLLADKLSAISSSLYALGAAIAQETDVQPCQIVAVEGLSGAILVVELANARNGMLLAVVSNDQAVLGELRWATKVCAGRMARAFGGS